MICIPLIAIQAKGDSSRSRVIRDIYPIIQKRRATLGPDTNLFYLRTIDKKLEEVCFELSGIGRLHLSRTSFTLILVGL